MCTSSKRKCLMSECGAAEMLEAACQSQRAAKENAA